MVLICLTLTAQMEFAVQMTCSSCEESVRAALDGVQGTCLTLHLEVIIILQCMCITPLSGVQSTYVDVENDLVLVEARLPTSRVQELLQATGRLVLFRGLGSSTGGTTAAAAVAIFRGGGVAGLVRLVQADEQHCVVEGTVDGLRPGPHQLRVLQYGDLSQGCARCSASLPTILLSSLNMNLLIFVCSCGEVLRVREEVPAAGDLATTLADSTGRAEFRCVTEQLKVSELIGRSLALQSTEG